MPAFAAAGAVAMIDTITDFNDRVYAQAVVFNGKLYAARNLRNPSTGALGAQLWVCDPALQGSATDCDPGDWSLVAPNATGATGQTTFENTNNAAITLLAATPAHLYVDFNNAVDGVVLFRSRTGVTSPAQRSDFEGTRGCSAANHPASCQGSGTNGFGVLTNKRVFAGEVLSFGGVDYVYLTAGDGGSGVRGVPRRRVNMGLSRARVGRQLERAPVRWPTDRAAAA